MWCPRGDSNPHAVKHRLLRPACLPIPPPGHGQEGQQTRSRHMGQEISRISMRCVPAEARRAKAGSFAEHQSIFTPGRPPSPGLRRAGKERKGRKFYHGLHGLTRMERSAISDYQCTSVVNFYSEKTLDVGRWMLDIGRSSPP